VQLSSCTYGERRDSDWDGPVSSADMTIIGNTTRTGFTGHEHLDAVGLIHMNGRVYDPLIGRFLGVDPVAVVGHGQGANTYAYVWNNPLRYVDPSGQLPVYIEDAAGGDSWETADDMFGTAGHWWDLLGKPFIGAWDPRWLSRRDTAGGPLTRPPPSVPAVPAPLPLAPAAPDAGRELHSELGGVVPVGSGDVLASPEIYYYSAKALEFIGYVLIAFDIANTASVVLAGPDTSLAAVPLFGAAASLRIVAARAGAKDVTYLYQKVGALGEHLKFGITKSPATRYTQEELAGGRLRIIGQGERQEMLRLERQLHETLPIGPEERQLFYIQKQIEKGLTPPPYGP